MEKKFTIERVSFELTIDGKDYKVTKPNMKMLKGFTRKQKELEENKDELAIVEESTKFLVDLGLPEEVCDELDPEMLEDITKIVTGQKKS